MAEYEPRPGHYAVETQRTANQLPMWTKFRREKDSVGQGTINPVCVHLDHIDEQLEEMLRDRFLELTGADKPDQLRDAKLPPELKLIGPAEVENRLLNSSFEIQTSHDRIPDYWQMVRPSQVDLGMGLLGSISIELQAALGAVSAIYQDVDEPIRAGVPWCFYAWYISTGTNLTAPAIGFGLEITGTHADNTTEILRKSFEPDTHGYPARAVLLASFAQDVVKWQFKIVLGPTATFPYLGQLFVDMAMAKEGGEVPNWKPNIFDNYPYIDYYDTLAPVVIEHPLRVQRVERMKDFWTKAIPNRAIRAPTLVSSGGTIDPIPAPDTDGFTLHGEAGQFTEVDFWKEEWPGRWQLGYQGTTPCIRGLGTKAPDIFGPFDLAFRNWRNWFEDEIDWTPEAMTALHDYLLVVLTKDDWNSVATRYLAIVDPKMPRPFPAYMEVVAMLEMGGIDVSTRITRADIRYSDQQHLFVGNGESEWVYELGYDYFMLDGARKTLQFREEYENPVPQVMVSRRDPELSLRTDLDNT